MEMLKCCGSAVECVVESLLLRSAVEVLWTIAA